MIQWESKYELQIPKIDMQHRVLVMLINRLEKLQNEHKTTTRDIDEILKHLSQYIDTHFKFEEDLLQQYDYPDFAAHKRQHEAFVAKVQEFRSKYEAGEDIGARVLTFLTDWLLHHINESDRDYAEQWQASGVAAKI